MTVIAWDGEMLAGDRQRNFNGVPTPARKVWRVKAKSGKVVLAGAAGDSSDTTAFIRWLQNGGAEPRPALANMDALVIDEHHRIWVCDHKLVYQRINGKRWAIGCGAHFALGAMACGKNAREAVRIASAHDIHCGMGADVVRFP